MTTYDPAEVQEMARWALRRYMHDCSEDRWAAGWRVYLEYYLWRDVLEAPEAPLPTGDDDDYTWEAEARRLRRLARMANGWYWVNPDGDRCEFIALDAWTRQYARRWQPDYPTRTLAQRATEDAARRRAIDEPVAALRAMPSLDAAKPLLRKAQKTPPKPVGPPNQVIREGVDPLRKR